MAAVSGIAAAPHTPTRSAARPIGAPPSRASTSPRDAPLAATPGIRLATETRPSLAPSIAAPQPIRPAAEVPLDTCAHPETLP
jgi:hypothetical protein